MEKNIVLRLRKNLNLQKHSPAYFPSSTVLKQCKTYRDYIYRGSKNQIREPCTEESLFPDHSFKIIYTLYAEKNNINPQYDLLRKYCPPHSD